jgi:hypothetical protein
MRHVTSLVTKLVLGTVAVGSLSIGTAGLAGASTPTTAPTTPTTVPAAAPTTGPATTPARHFNCARATKVLTRIQKGEARIAAKLPGLTAREARAEKAGRTTRAAHLQRLIARLESRKFSARLTKVSGKIEAKCHVSAPTPSSGSTTSTTS